MAQPVQPDINIPGDSSDKIMARSGDVIGITKSRVLWRFGFLPGSDSARAYGVSTPEFVWVKATWDGKALESFRGFGTDLPKTFRNVIDWNWYQVNK
jgi:hypothetical protein